MGGAESVLLGLEGGERGKVLIDFLVGLLD